MAYNDHPTLIFVSRGHCKSILTTFIYHAPSASLEFFETAHRLLTFEEVPFIATLGHSFIYRMLKITISKGATLLQFIKKDMV